ncbi:MAG: VOC family protein [Actinomycetota bacterium]|nr:VOC family protein [Actinomycetota bacterium]
MDDEEIRGLLAGIEPLMNVQMPIPPNMSALAVSAVVDAGGDPEEIEAWVKQRRGWAKRIPPQFLAPETRSDERKAVVFLVPDRELQGGGAPARGAGRRPGGGPPPVLGTADLVAFMPTTNLTQAKAFYGTMLGLAMEGESPIAVTFDANGTTFRAVLVERFTPFAFTIVGWTVEDIAATVTELTSRGIAFQRFESIKQDHLGVWRSPGGAQVAWFKDPFGNTISLTQF